MLLNELEWSDAYEIGQTDIDAAHREIFAMAKRIYLQSYDPAKRQLAAKEGLGFLKSYVLRHFADEEAYMLEIAYPDLPMHRAEHKAMKDTILPRMEEDLREQQWSDEAVDHFLQILMRWLSNHIIEHDLSLKKD